MSKYYPRYKTPSWAKANRDEPERDFYVKTYRALQAGMDAVKSARHNFKHQPDGWLLDEVEQTTDGWRLAQSEHQRVAAESMVIYFLRSGCSIRAAAEACGVGRERLRRAMSIYRRVVEGETVKCEPATLALGREAVVAMATAEGEWWQEILANEDPRIRMRAWHMRGGEHGYAADEQAMADRAHEDVERSFSRQVTAARQRLVATEPPHELIAVPEQEPLKITD